MSEQLDLWKREFEIAGSEKEVLKSKQDVEKIRENIREYRLNRYGACVTKDDIKTIKEDIIPKLCSGMKGLVSRNSVADVFKLNSDSYYQALGEYLPEHEHASSDGSEHSCCDCGKSTGQADLPIDTPVMVCTTDGGIHWQLGKYKGGYAAQVGCGFGVWGCIIPCDKFDYNQPEKFVGSQYDYGLKVEEEKTKDIEQ